LARPATGLTKRDAQQLPVDYFSDRFAQSREPSHFLEMVGPVRVVEPEHGRKVLIRPRKGGIRYGFIEVEPSEGLGLLLELILVLRDRGRGVLNKG
jgi:hypothetical protein